MGVSGTIIKVNLDGIPFDAFADADFSEVGSNFNNEAIPTSGDPVIKMAKRNRDVDGVMLKAGTAEKEILKELADRKVGFPMSYTEIDGSVMRCGEGKINYDARTTQENKASIKFIPIKPWTSFVG